jgi:hypothetical protein
MCVCSKPQRESELSVALASADPWVEKPRAADWVFEKDIPKTRPAGLSKPNRPQIPAVEVDEAGCSYNPDYEHHQDAIAAAVAREVQEQLSKELAPKVRQLKARLSNPSICVQIAEGRHEVQELD